MTAVHRAEAAATTQVLDAAGVDRALTRLAHEIRERHPEDARRVVIAGIREGGVAVAAQLTARLRTLWGHDVPLVALDVTGFRDDRPRHRSLKGAWEPLASEALPPEPGRDGVAPRQQPRTPAMDGAAPRQQPRPPAMDGAAPGNRAPFPEVDGVLPGNRTPPSPGTDGPDGMIVVLVDDVIQTGRTMRAAFDLVASRGRPAAIEMAVLVDRGGREVPVRPTHVGRNLPVSPAEWVEIRLGIGAGEPGIFLVPAR